MDMFSQDVCALASVDGNNRSALLDAARLLTGAFTDLLNVARPGSDEVQLKAVLRLFQVLLQPTVFQIFRFFVLETNFSHSIETNLFCAVFYRKIIDTLQESVCAYLSNDTWLRIVLTEWQCTMVRATNDINSLSVQFFCMKFFR